MLDGNSANGIAVPLDALFAIETDVVDRERQLVASNPDHQRQLLGCKRPRPVKGERVQAAAHRQCLHEADDAEDVIGMGVGEQHVVDIESETGAQKLSLVPSPQSTRK